MFNLTTYSILLEAGQTRPDFPGFLAASAPRKSARLRGQDQVILFFSQSGSMPLAANAQREMLNRLAETYFTASGSVTAGMRAMAERLNDFLLARNVRGARTGGQMVGLISLAVIHGGRLYLAQGGPVHTYRLSGSGVEHFQDAEGMSRGMGVAKVISLRYYQAEVAAGDTLIWTVENLENLPDESQSMPVAELARRLTGDVLDMQGGLVRLGEGKGEILAVAPPAAISASSVGYTPVPEGVYLSGKIAVSEPSVTEAAEKIPQVGMTEPAAVAPVQTPVEEKARVESPRRAAYVEEEAPEPEGPSPAAAAAARAAVDGIGRMRKAGNSFSRGLERLFERAMPGNPDRGLNVSPGNMLFVAIMIPLVIVAVAMTVYYQRGRSEQHQLYLQSAQYFFEQSNNKEDLGLRRDDWNQALYWLDKASGYGSSEEADALYDAVLAKIDEVDGVDRLVYRPVATGDLPTDANITRMMVYLNDIYMLDSTQGRIMRLRRSGQNYEYDEAFVCGPGQAGGTVIGPLLDFVTLFPGNDFDAAVMAIDGGGNLVFCTPNVAGFSSMALPVPETNWGRIEAISYAQGSLYVLDPAVNRVWRFDPAAEGLGFEGLPHLYFTDNVPNLNDVADMILYEDYLYILNEDGTMTTCRSNGESTDCTEPTPYGDARTGRESSPLAFADASFIQLQVTEPPDPSLYVLDKQNQSIYQFSQRKLNLQGQYRPDSRLSSFLPVGEPTSFVVSPNRRAFLAFGNQVFFAPME
ncbi:MAG: hypothetical protein JW987_16785 [Anaerolineaceae bacterium]|nr:hypothetical protein [Anaerolineaceae bacterium]